MREHGSIAGNQALGSRVRLTNQHHFSDRLAGPRSGRVQPGRGPAGSRRPRRGYIAPERFATMTMTQISR
jgi:hypothetical protein